MINFMTNEESFLEDCFVTSKLDYCERPNGSYVRIATEEIDDAVHVKIIVNAMKRLTVLDDVPLLRVEERLGIFRIAGEGGWFERLLAGVDLGLKDRYPYHVFHPLVEAFFEVIPQLSIGGWDVRAYPGKLVLNYVERINSAAKALRTAAQKMKWQAAERNFRRGATKNRNSLIDLFNGLSNKYSKLLVIRIDLGYTSGRGFEVDSNRSFFAKTMRQQAALRLMLRKNFRSNYVGYAIKVEYGLLKGYHHHAFFFFNGNKLHGDVSIAKWIGDAWAHSINEGSGVYFNCNAYKDSYRHCGIGMGRWDDLKFIKAFERAATYVTKPDEYMQIRKSRIG